MTKRLKFGMIMKNRPDFGDTDAYFLRYDAAFDADGNPTREPRLYETVAVPGDTWKDGSMAPVFTNSQKYVAGVGFLQKKFILDTDSDRAGKPVQWPYLRLPEVMLSYAEAINEYNGGPDDIAYKQINDVRARVGMPAVPSGLSQTEFREALIKERALEFGYEEVRWFDLVRWGRKDDFTKKLYGLQSSVATGSNTAPKSFNFSVTEIATRNWATSWDTKWYLAAFPQTEVSAQETKILPGNLEMARRMVPQGAVLLRNESDVLPLPHGERVAVFGSGQLAFQPGGGGASLFAASIPRFSSTGCRIQFFYRNISVISLQLFPFPQTGNSALSQKGKLQKITTRR